MVGVDARPHGRGSARGRAAPEDLPAPLLRERRVASTTADDESPESLPAPEAPEAPNAPEVPEVPDVPEAPDCVNPRTPGDEAGSLA